VPRLPLLAGLYRLSVAVVDSVDNETFDYHDRLYDFHVIPDSHNERYGFVTLGGAWRPEVTPDRALQLVQETQQTQHEE
jgi:hypothetical protein